MNQSPPPPVTVALVEDEPADAELMHAAFESAGHCCRMFDTGAAGAGGASRAECGSLLPHGHRLRQSSRYPVRRGGGAHAKRVQVRGTAVCLLARDELLKDIWGYGPEINSRTIDIHVSRLRKTLRLHPEEGWQLISIYQHGYRLDRFSKPE